MKKGNLDSSWRLQSCWLAADRKRKETTTTTARPVKTTIVESRSIIRKDFSGIVEGWNM